MALLATPRAVELDHLILEPLAERTRVQVQQRAERCDTQVATGAHVGSSCLRRAMATTFASRDSSSASTCLPNAVRR